MPDVDIKGKISRVGEYLPSINVSTTDIKQFLTKLKDETLQILLFISLGILSGILLPIALILLLFVLSLTASSITALFLFIMPFTASPITIARAIYSFFRSVGSAKKIVRWIPWSYKFGGIAGLGLYVYMKLAGSGDVPEWAIQWFLSTIEI